MMDGGSDFSVLIVDDHERTRKVMATLVGHLGCAEVVTAGDAQSAPAKMRERSFDVIERAASEGVELLPKPFRAAALVDILSRMMGREGVKRLLN